MARTGVNIKVQNTVLGQPPNVDSNSLLVVCGAVATTGDIPFTLGTPFMLQSAQGLTDLNITETNNPELFKEVNDYYSQVSGVLWIVGTVSNSGVLAGLESWVRKTVVNGFQYQPRNILISSTNDPEALDTDMFQNLQQVIDRLYNGGFCVVAICGLQPVTGPLSTPANVTALTDLSVKASPMVAGLIVTNVQGARPCVGLIGGLMASLSVGTSIGARTLPSLGTDFFFNDSDGETLLNTPCALVGDDSISLLGDKQYLFARTAPPRNGLWMNDGATADDPANSLSSLSGVRVLASMTDELRTFFTRYIETNVPVSRNGDIQPAYKQVVLNNARESIIQPYINSGDISDAELDFIAKNNDMIGTRTWEVTLRVQAAPTLRWIDGFVFYVSTLN